MEALLLKILLDAAVLVAVLFVLVVVHEFGHFIVAKLSGMRVDEFGLGFPPRALTLWKGRETEYTLNWLPIGGFVRIHGEDGIVDAEKRGDDPRAFTSKPRILQVLVIIAGVTMNLVIAYVLLTGALIAGMPHELTASEAAHATNAHLTVDSVLPGSPADKAGLTPGDEILAVADANGAWHAHDFQSFSDFISASGGEALSVSVLEPAGATKTYQIMPQTGLIPAHPARYALGVSVGLVSSTPLPVARAVVEGAAYTWTAMVLTLQGLGHLFYGLVTFHANLSGVAGPVGIAPVVGNAAQTGWGTLLFTMAAISISLAFINLLPIPALDGGRLLLVLIEWIVRRKVPARVSIALINASFVFLLLLMVVVTAHDIFRLAG